MSEGLVFVGLGTTAMIISLGFIWKEVVRAYRANLSPVSVKVSLTFCWVDLEESGVISSFISADIVRDLFSSEKVEGEPYW